MHTPQYIHIDVTSYDLRACMFYDIHHILYQKTHVVYQISLSITNVVDCGVLTIHESNAPFPVTRHQYRMMCNKGILQLYSEDLNQSVSPKISYHYIRSVTVSSSKSHPICASCMLPRHVLVGHLDP